MPGPELVDGKLGAEERAKASKWVSHQAQSIVRKATLILMVRAERTLPGRLPPPPPHMSILFLHVFVVHFCFLSFFQLICQVYVLYESARGTLKKKTPLAKQHCNVGVIPR